MMSGVDVGRMFSTTLSFWRTRADGLAGTSSTSFFYSVSSLTISLIRAWIFGFFGDL